MRRIGRGMALVATLIMCAPAAAAAAPDPPDPGKTTPGTVTSNGSEYNYLLHTPTSYRAGRRAPLLVMVHGCQTTAEQQMKANRFNPIAEREGFVVLYPDVDAAGRAQPGPLRQCWKFHDPSAYFRGNSDSAAIAAMTRAAMAQRAIDPERVYLVGISAGGLMASIEAAAYPELYAAVGVVASAGYADGPCFTTGVGIPVSVSAQLAHVQMGPRARIVPRFVMGGDADLAFPANCVHKALEQGLRTNNLVISASQERPIALAPTAVRRARKPGGRAYTVRTYRDPAGCLIGENWIIHGMAHFWPGGTTDSRYAGFTDSKAPSGAEASWAFLRRYRKSDTGMPCAESPASLARARLQLSLKGRRARTPSRRRCFRGPVRVTVTGASRRLALRGRFRMGARRFRDSRPPLSRVYRDRHRGPSHVHKAKASVRLKDGRLVRLTKRFRVCARGA
jgi:poly(hydroxyalkanoate) depolymerase family esterase